MGPIFGNGLVIRSWIDVVGFTAMAAFGIVGGAALTFVTLYLKNTQTLRMLHGELRPSEAVKKETKQNVVYYRTGRPLRIWEQTGGKLFLTTSHLIFKAHPDQPWAYWAYDIAVPLEEIVVARACFIIGSQNGLLIEKADGGRDLYGCAPENAREWASAIMVLRGMGPTLEGSREHGTAQRNSPVSGSNGATDIKTEGPVDITDGRPRQAN
jgi:hypothetical protein